MGVNRAARPPAQEELGEEGQPEHVECTHVLHTYTWSAHVEYTRVAHFLDVPPDMEFLTVADLSKLGCQQ